jgi:hypothetical protein
VAADSTTNRPSVVKHPFQLARQAAQAVGSALLYSRQPDSSRLVARYFATADHKPEKDFL